MVAFGLAWLLGAVLSGSGIDLGAVGPWGQRSPAELAEAEREVAEVRALVDGYQGDPRVLLEARQRLARVLRAAPRYAPAHVQAARITYKLGYLSGRRYEPRALTTALAQVDRAIALDPGLAEAFLIRGWIMLFQGEPVEARRMAERVAALDPGSLDVLELEAAIDETEGRLEDARARYLELLARAPDDATRLDAWSGLSTVQCELEDYAACEEAHRAIIELDPGSAWARGNYALFLLKLERWDDAIANAEAALRIMDYGMARSVLANAHVGKGWTFIRATRGGDASALPSALSHFRAALEAVPDFPKAHYGIGVVHFEQRGRATSHAERLAAATRAANAFRTASELDPKNTTYREWAGRAGAERRRLAAVGATPPSPRR